eukprot:366239-Chlamydomonas_euryale.AAC.12
MSTQTTWGICGDAKPAFCPPTWRARAAVAPCPPPQYPSRPIKPGVPGTRARGRCSCAWGSPDTCQTSTRPACRSRRRERPVSIVDCSTPLKHTWQYITHACHARG